MRLEKTRGVLKLSGGEKFHVVIPVRRADFFEIIGGKNRLLELELDDIEYLKITHRGEKINIAPDKIRGIREFKQGEGGIFQLSGAGSFKGKILKIIGNSVIIKTPQGNFKIDRKLLGNIIINNNSPRGIQLKSGETGIFITNGDNPFRGRLLQVTEHTITIETKSGRMQLLRNDIIYAGIEEVWNEK